MRRLMKISRKEDFQVREETLNEFDEIITTAGYQTPERENIMVRGINGYKTLRERERKEERKVHRS